MRNFRAITNFIERYIFYVLIFSIPFQTRKVFYFWGVSFNEWASIFLYWTDILVLALFIFWIAKKRGRFDFLRMKKIYILLLAFLVCSGISVFFADNQGLGLYNWLKLSETIFLFIYIRNFIKIEGEKGLMSIWGVFILSAFFQSGIAMTQFFYQSDLGLRVFQESPIGILIDGVAKVNFGGLKMIRAYGTFPHPNVLAAFLGIGIFSCYWLLLNNGYLKRIKSFILWFILAALFMGLFFTFSRSVIALTVILSIFFLAFSRFYAQDNYQKKKIRELLLIVILCVVVLALLLWPIFIERFNVDINEQAVNLRAFYTKVALDFIKKSPFFGVGIGNFVYFFQNPESIIHNLELWQYQPVHNLYLLIASETGIIGLILFLGFIGVLLRNIFLRERGDKTVGNIYIFYILYSIFLILFLGLTDHYFWTLQQGRLMMWMVFAIAGANYRSLTNIPI